MEGAYGRDKGNLETIKWANLTVRLGDLKPWEHNPKSISKAHAKRLLASWEKFGQFQTVAIGPDCEVYDGHQRLSVLRAAHGDGFRVDARQSSRALTDEERRQLVIEAHAGTTGQFDWDALANWDAAELQEWGLDGELLKDWKAGINAVTELIDSAKPELPEDAGAQIDKAEELRERWGVESGQMWKLGEHRIICGDCTDRAVVEKVMGGEKAEITFTSPPYNLGTNIKLSTRNKKDNAYIDEYQDDKTQVDYVAFLNSVFDNILELSAYHFINLQLLAGNKQAIIEFVFTHKEHLADVAIWYKKNPQPAAAKNVMNSAFEFIFIFSRDSEPTRAINTAHFHGTFSNVYSGTVNSENIVPELHSAAFPLSMCEEFIKEFSAGDVFEPFCGTGTTLIACERLSRKCRAVEISPGYVAVSIQRWVDLTGGVPELIELGDKPE